MKKKDKVKKKINIKNLIIGISIIIIFLLLTFIVGKPLIELVSDKDRFKTMIDSYGIFGKTVYILIAIVQVLLAFIPSEAIEIAGGYAFGSVIGTLLCLIGVTLGSIIVILLTKKFGRKFVNLFYSDEQIDEIKIFKNEKKLSGIIFIIFLLPGTPKDLVTYIVGLTKLKLKDYLILTTFARIPNIIISSLAGSALAENKTGMAIMFFVLSVLTGAIGLLFYKYYYSKKITK